MRDTQKNCRRRACDMSKKNLLPFNIQFFAEPDGGSNPTPAEPDGGQQTQQIDYDELAGIIAGKQSAAEETVLKGYFKQQGLSKEEMESAIAAFKKQKAEKEQNVDAIQQQAQQALEAAKQATIEKEAFMLSAELGLELKTMPYVLKMADLSEVSGEDGKIDKEKLKGALNKVLEDVPALKGNSGTGQQSGFRQIGSEGGQPQGGNQDEALKNAFEL